MNVNYQLNISVIELLFEKSSWISSPTGLILAFPVHSICLVGTRPQPYSLYCDGGSMVCPHGRPEVKPSSQSQVVTSRCFINIC